MSLNFSNFILSAMTCFFLLSSSAHAEMSQEEAVSNANRLHKLLTGGIPLLPSNPLYSSVVSRLKAADYLGAAAVITDPKSGADAFYNNVVASLPVPMNRESVNTNPPNEMSAMFLVVARDSMPLSDLLTKNFTAHDEVQPVHYAPDDSKCNGSPSDCNSEHYIRVFQGNAKKSLKVIERSGFPGVGIYTSYAWGINYDFMGTERRNVEGTVKNLYCSTMDSMRTRLIPDVAIGRDVDRTDPNFNTDCKTCHGHMDEWRKAFLAKTVTTANAPPALRFIWKAPSDSSSITDLTFDKLNSPIAGNLYPATTTAFNFFFTDDQNRILGIDFNKLPVQDFAATGVHYVHGQGLADFANIVANSRGFYRCMVKRIVAQLYMKMHFNLSTMSQEDLDELNGQANTIETFAGVLQQNQDLADIYRRIAVWYLFQK